MKKETRCSTLIAASAARSANRSVDPPTSAIRIRHECHWLSSLRQPFRLILLSSIPYSFRRGSSNEEARMSDSIDRRQFLQSATLAATAATAVTGAVTGSALAAEAKPGAKSAQHSGPLTRRWTEQRWLLDNTIRSVGMDWDQPRSAYLSAPCGPDRKSTRLNSSHDQISYA